MWQDVSSNPLNQNMLIYPLDYQHFFPLTNVMSITVIRYTEYSLLQS